MRRCRHGPGERFSGYDVFMLGYFWSAPIVTDTLFEQPAQAPPPELLAWRF